jgi:DNA-binding transcriptional ArsR family regulator
VNNDENTRSLDIDRLIHEPARLKIMAQLYVIESADFIFLMRRTQLTWGNLSSHMSKLETALTEKGKAAFRSYRKVMQKVLNEIPK